jgi:muramoyltetrapeptide carboxypeptidase
MNTLKGKAVPAGGTIGIVSPASPYTYYSDVLKGIAWWEDHGYHVKLAQGALERTDYFAGSPERRANDLAALFADAQVEAIQCLRGGFGSAEVIPLLDFRVIEANPKPFIGFSDITALHCAIQHFTGLATFYGPSLTSLGDPALPDFTATRLLAVLAGETTGLFPRNPSDPFLQVLAPGKASGRLVGGCLSDLMHTLGTPWEFDLDEAIFAFEEVGSSPHGIERALLQLAQAGKLKRVRGIVIGDLVGCEWSDGGGAPWPRTKTLPEVLEDRLGALGVPVLYGFPFGHGNLFATLPLGVQATLDADARTLAVVEAALK